MRKESKEGGNENGGRGVIVKSEARVSLRCIFYSALAEIHLTWKSPAQIKYSPLVFSF